MDKLNEIISNIFNINLDEIDERKGPNDIDMWDSIQHLNLVTAIQDEFEITFDLKEILEIMSIGDIYKVLKRKGAL